MKKILSLLCCAFLLGTLAFAEDYYSGYIVKLKENCVLPIAALYSGSEIEVLDKAETATLLSLDFVSAQDAEEMSPAWLEDPNDLEETVLTSVMEQEFRLLLSERQLEVYRYCLLGGMSMTDYSKARGIDVSTVFEAKRDVQKKAKIFFKETPKN